ncbi:hypothetical protein M758_1G179800, partial [Ceratodon purpureus]
MEDSLAFDEYMSQFEHGGRGRIRHSLPRVYENSTPTENQPRENESLMRGGERARRYNLRSTSTQGQPSSAQGNFSIGEGDQDPTLSNGDGGEDLPSSQEEPNSGRRGAATKKHVSWTNAQLKLAIDAVTDEGVKVRAAARHFGIPYTSLRDHMYGKVLGRKRGPKTVLSSEEEEKLVDYCFKMQKLGHPLTPMQLKLKVAQVT